MARRSHTDKPYQTIAATGGGPARLRGNSMTLRNSRWGLLIGALLLGSCGGGGGGGNPVTVGPTPIPPGQVASIAFSTATPSFIYIAGIGKIETTILRFLTQDANGAPGPDGTVVNFTLQGPNGGEYIGTLDSTPTQAASTTSGGIAEISLHSGRVAGSVTVTARVDNSPTQSVTGRSPGISIGGGVAAAGRFTLASSKTTLAMAAGQSTVITAFVADRFGNTWGLEGSQVSFYSEAGATIDVANVLDFFGQTSVNLVADGTTPVGFGGRLTILAVVNGEEAFTDQTGNGLYTLGEPFVELGEPFVDANETGLYEAPELYLDTDRNGIYTTSNGLWDGPGCPAAGCLSIKPIWARLTLPMSGNAVCTGVTPNPFAIANGGSQGFTFQARDIFGNDMISGTTVAVALSGAGTLTGQTSATTDGVDPPTTLTFTLADATVESPNVVILQPATITITVAPPATSGLIGCTVVITGTVD